MKLKNNTKKMLKKNIFIIILIFVLVFQNLALVCAVPRTSIDEKEEEISQLKDDLITVEKELQYLEETKISIETRLEVIKEQSARTFFKLESAENQLNKYEKLFEERVLTIYKTGPINFLEVLLTSSSFADFLFGIKYLTRIISSDTKLLNSIVKEKKEIENIQEELNEQKRYQAILFNEHQSRLRLIEEKKNNKEDYLDKATEELKNIITQEQEKYDFRYNSALTSDWSLDREVQIVLCEVEPYYGQYFWVSERMPRRYITKQEKFTGLASWYGPGFHGKRTASGEIFNQNDFTCAHKILPLGSYVLVTYKGRSIVLKVNDRGPFIPGRVLDLSKAAAYYLGFTGVVEVEAEIVEPVL